jgi:hypothetical protein
MRFALALLVFLVSIPQVYSIAIGDRVQATDNLKIRSLASLSGSHIDTASSGALGTVIGGSSSADGYIWWRIDWDSFSTGWSVSNYLAVVPSTPSPGSFTLSNDPPVWDSSPPAGPAVQLRWSSSSNATSYEVFRGGSKIYTFSGTAFRNETGLSGGQTYSYHIVAKNSAGSRQSNSISVTMPNEPPAIPSAPSYLEGQFFAYRVELGWTDASTNEQGFKIERRVGSGGWTQIATVGAMNGSGSDVFWTDSSTQPKTAYSYRVRAYNTLGNSAYTNETSLTTPAGRPGSFTLSNSAPIWDTALPGPKVTLNWTASADAGGYAVYRNGSLYIAGISGTSFVNQSGLDAAATYTYLIRASNSEGTTDSNTITVTMPNAPPSAPASPTGLSASQAASAINLAWSDQSNNETGFKIERRPAIGVIWSALVTLGANVTTYSDTQVASATGYVYRVRAYNGIGPSNYSNEAAATSAPPGAPGAFTLTSDPPIWDSTSPPGPAVTLRWTAASGATSYEVFRDGLLVYPTTSTPFTGRAFTNEVGLTPGGSHSFQIFAVNAGGRTSSNSLALVMPNAPTGDAFITGITPSTIAGVPLPDRVRVEVTGRDFRPGIRAYVSYSGQSNILLDATHTERISDTQVALRIATSTEADTWTVQLRNTDNRWSNTATFQVTAPTNAVSLSSISPSNTMPSTSPRSFTLTGSGFGLNDQVKITYSSGNPVFLSAPDVAFISSSSLRFSHVFSNAPASVSVRVVKPSGTESSPVTLTLERTLMPDLLCDPASIVVTPSSVAVGRQITVACTIRNVGGGSAGASFARFRLSTDNVLTKLDPLLSISDVIVPAIPAGEQQSISRTFTIPATTQPGTYRVGLFVDVGDDVAQSNTSNDGAVDGDTITVTGSVTTPAAPVFTLLPKNTTINEGQTLTLTAKATGAVAYRWYFNDIPWEYNAPALNGVSTLKAYYAWVNLTGSYYVVAVGADGTETRSAPSASVSVRSTNANGYLPGDDDHEEVALSSWSDLPVDPAFPTVVLTHGWQKESDSNWSASGPSGFQTLAANVRGRFIQEDRRNVNILIFTWKDAYQWLGAWHVAGSSAEGAGKRLAKLLTIRLGTDYSQPIHFVGHSYGCFVNAAAAGQLFAGMSGPRWAKMPTSKQQRRVHITPLDPAFQDLTQWSPDSYLRLLAGVKTIGSIDHYYAKSLTATGVPIPGTGPQRGGKNVYSELGTLQLNHSEVWEVWYQRTVYEKAQQTGFFYSIALGEKGGWSSLVKDFPWPEDTSSLMTRVIYSDTANSTPAAIIPPSLGASAPSIKESLSFTVSGGTWVPQVDTLNAVSTPMFDVSLIAPSSDSLRATKSKQARAQPGTLTAPGDHQVVMRLPYTVPKTATAMRFFAKRLTNDSASSLSIAFGGTPLKIVGLDYLEMNDFTEMYVPLTGLRGQSGVLEIWVHNASAATTTIRLGKIEFLHDVAVKAAANALAITAPTTNTRLLTDRVTITGRWISPVPLESLVVTLNGTAAIPLQPAATGVWSVELGPLEPGTNAIEVVARTIHGQSIALSRKVKRMVPATLEVEVQGTGTVSGAKLGSNHLEVGRLISLRAIPRIGHVFDRWSGALNGSLPSARLLVEDGMSVTAHFVPSPFIEKSGSYNATFVATDNAWSGWAQLTVNTQGYVTGTVTIAGKKVSVKGQMDASGKLVIFLPTLGVAFTAQVDLAASVPSLTASIWQGDKVLSQAIATRAAYDGIGLKAPQAGRYTLVFDLPPAPGSQPPAYGWGTVSVSSKGKITFSGRLPNGVAVTQTSDLTSNNQWHLFAPTHSSKGWISGSLNLGDGDPETPVSGVVAWVKPVTSGSFLPAPISGALSVLGSRYTPPTLGQLVIRGLAPTGDNLLMTWGTSLATPPTTTNLALSKAHRVTSTSPNVTVTVNTSNGVFSGSAPHPATGTTSTFSGVFLQHQRRAHGFIKTPVTTSDVSIAPLDGLQTVNITASATPLNAGTVEGFGSVTVGQTVTLTATPSAGYQFVHWSENGATVSSNQVYSFTASSNRNLLAVFEAIETLPTNRLVVHYRFDDGSLADSVVGNSQAVVNGVATPVQGVKQGAIQLGGSPNFIDSPFSSYLPEWTGACYVRLTTLPSNGNTASLIDAWKDEENYRIQVRNTSGSTRIFARFHKRQNELSAFPEIEIGSSSTLQAGVDYHVLATFDGSYLRLYVNGQLEGETPQIGNAYSVRAQVSPDLRLGIHDGGSFLNGVLDEVKIFNRAVSPTEALALAEVSLLSTMRFRDDFNDNSIDATKWTSRGTEVTETSQVMKVLQNQTDLGGVLNAMPFPIASEGKIVVSRRAFIHYSGTNSRPKIMFEVGSLPRFGVAYANDSYGGHPYMAKYGFFVTRNNANEANRDEQGDVSLMVEPIWDQWFTERFEYLPSTGELDYFINDMHKSSFNVGIMPPATSPMMSLEVHSWGWFTGQQHLMDDLEITQRRP